MLKNGTQNGLKIGTQIELKNGTGPGQGPPDSEWVLGWVFLQRRPRKIENMCRKKCCAPPRKNCKHHRHKFFYFVLAEKIPHREQKKIIYFASLFSGNLAHRAPRAVNDFDAGTASPPTGTPGNQDGGAGPPTTRTRTTQWTPTYNATRHAI